MWQQVKTRLTSDSWNQFVIKNGPASGRFLQSWEWAEFQSSVGEQVERWVDEETEITGVATIIKKKVPGFGSYAYCPRGPVVEKDFSPALQSLGDMCASDLFLRCDLPTQEKQLLAGLHKTIDRQPAMTRITHLSLPDETLFASLHAKTRYNIRLAQKHGVKIRFDVNDFEKVWPLFSGTSARGQFRLHEKDYYQHMLASLNSESCRAFLATAWLEDQVVAANIMIDFGDTRTYLHGASSYEHRAVMAPHLLHWELLKEAHQKQLAHYDWWGVAPVDQPNHPWAGISRFKRAFVGEDIVYAGTYDLVKKPVKYNMYLLARRLRRIFS